MTAVYILLAIIIAMGLAIIWMAVANSIGIDALEDLIRELRTKENARILEKRKEARGTEETQYVSSIEELRQAINRSGAEGFMIQGFDPYRPSIILIKTRMDAPALQLSIVPNGKGLAKSKAFSTLWGNIVHTSVQSNQQTADTIADMIAKAAREENK